MITVIFHSADFDGLFSMAIARHFLEPIYGDEVRYIGWDHGQKPLEIPTDGMIYVIDLPCDTVFGFRFPVGPATIDYGLQAFSYIKDRLVWIDHHIASIKSHPATIPGYRIDGVSACRLAWQWFSIHEHNAQNGTNESLQADLPSLNDYGVPIIIDGKEVGRSPCMVSEPWAVKLAGQYDVWDKQTPEVDSFQFGLKSLGEISKATWDELLSGRPDAVTRIIQDGVRIEKYQRHKDEKNAQRLAFDLKFAGLTFCAINSPEVGTLASTTAVKPHHDAFMAFWWNGKKWTISMRHVKGREHHDLSVIASRLNGGGHSGSCGFSCRELPFKL